MIKELRLQNMGHFFSNFGTGHANSGAVAVVVVVMAAVVVVVVVVVVTMVVAMVVAFASFKAFLHR